jgi:hypothetical protein
MFWNKGRDTTLEPYNKFKFIATFSGFVKTTTNPLSVLGSELPPDLNLRVHVKKIDAPKINFEFERAYANEYVDYFQKGSIHWESMNITFIDSVIKNNQRSFTLREILNDYISSLNGFNNSNQSFQDNRTNLVDLPSFCETIQIASFSTFANSSYPSAADLKQYNSGQSLDTQLGKSLDKYNNIFTITRPRITKIDFGSLDYSSDDINEITISVVPEWCSNQNSDSLTLR